MHTGAIFFLNVCVLVSFVGLGLCFALTPYARCALPYLGHVGGRLNEWRQFFGLEVCSKHAFFYLLLTQRVLNQTASQVRRDESAKSNRAKRFIRLELSVLYTTLRPRFAVGTLPDGVCLMPRNNTFASPFASAHGTRRTPRQRVRNDFQDYQCALCAQA